MKTGRWHLKQHIYMEMLKQAYVQSSLENQYEFMVGRGTYLEILLKHLTERANK